MVRGILGKSPDGIAQRLETACIEGTGAGDGSHRYENAAVFVQHSIDCSALQGIRIPQLHYTQLDQLGRVYPKFRRDYSAQIQIAVS